MGEYCDTARAYLSGGGIEGTDALIDRAGELASRVEARFANANCADLSLDMPTFGLNTLEVLHQANFAGALLEGKTLVLNQDRLDARERINLLVAGWQSDARSKGLYPVASSGGILGAGDYGPSKTYGNHLELKGLGGPVMRRQACHPFRLCRCRLNGIGGGFTRYFRLRHRLQVLKEAIADFSPDVLILIDAQGLSYRIGRHFADAFFKKLRPVAPTAWAWKPECGKAATYLDHMACPSL